MAEVAASWFNARSLLDGAELKEIYQHERPEDDGWLYPEQVIAHGQSTESTVTIPDELRYRYAEVGRPTPLTRATALERHLGTSCQIWLKREDLLPNGSFKITSALPQAHYGAAEGRRSVVTETGAGQTGVAAALASCLSGLACEVFMVRSSFDDKPLRRRLMEAYGAVVHASPSDTTAAGRRFLERGEEAGSIAMATSEVFDVLRGREDGMNIAGSLLDFTLLYASLIGIETVDQLRAVGVDPDVAIGCVGGGSSFGGFAFPLLDAFPEAEIVAVESASIPTLTAGRYVFDHPDGEGDAPPIKMYSLGFDYRPPPMHASGLRYHAASPLVSAFVHSGRMKAEAYDEPEAMEAGLLLARLQGLVISPESTYTLLAAIRRAEQAGPGRAIVALVTGSGHLDLDAYGRFLTPA
ncbi:MAG: tryptophan synthase beta chain [Acidimicrobiaceae bacterium]|jgi:pyridoxal-phosphate dependent TrpB-like enzyme|nr:tryptophan synthase beta chain [Acidimicrobiaceae bacterium]